MGKLKILAIIAVFMAVAQAFAPIPGQAANRAAPESQKQDEGGKSSQNPAKTISPASKPENGNNRDLKPEFLAGSETYAQPTINITNPVPAHVPWPLHDKILWWANLILAGVGICGVVAAVCTLLILNRQTNYMITSERAWFVCRADMVWDKGEDNKTVGRIGFRYENIGKTPGFITEIGFAVDVLNSDQELPQIPQSYQNGDTSQWTAGRGLLIVPGDNMGRRASWVPTPQAPLDFLQSEKLIMWVHGYVKYRDSFVEQIRETRYCLRLNPHGTDSVPFFIDGPPAYNSAT